MRREPLPSLTDGVGTCLQLDSVKDATFPASRVRLNLPEKISPRRHDQDVGPPSIPWYVLEDIRRRAATGRRPRTPRPPSGTADLRRQYLPLRRRRSLARYTESIVHQRCIRRKRVTQASRLIAPRKADRKPEEPIPVCTQATTSCSGSRPQAVSPCGGLVVLPSCLASRLR